MRLTVVGALLDTYPPIHQAERAHPTPDHLPSYAGSAVQRYYPGHPGWPHLSRIPAQRNITESDLELAAYLTDFS